MSDFATAPIHTFVRNDRMEGGACAIAMFFPYSDYPIYFMAEGEIEAIDKAIDWRNEQLAKVEHIRKMKQENMKKAKAAKQRKGIK